MADVVFPRLDEAPALLQVLSGLLVGYRAIVADNGSTDRSVGMTQAPSAKVIEVPRRGFDAAVHAALEAATASVLSIVDVGGSFDSRRLTRAAAPVLADATGVVLGRRVRAAGAEHAHIAALAAVLR